MAPSISLEGSPSRFQLTERACWISFNEVRKGINSKKMYWQISTKQTCPMIYAWQNYYFPYLLLFVTISDIESCVSSKIRHMKILSIFESRILLMAMQSENESSWICMTSNYRNVVWLIRIVGCLIYSVSFINFVDSRKDGHYSTNSTR